jgi:saccharopine dehydrogenase (NAD+, L-lysine-forming)
MRIVALGGAGLMGRSAVADLAAQPGAVAIVIADRDLAGARAVAARAGGANVTATQIDVRDLDALVALLRDADAVLNSVNYAFNLPVMRAALEARTAYVDLGGLFHVTRQQWELHGAFAEAGVCAVLSMGSAPGITNVQSRYAADRLDRVNAIRCYDGISVAAMDRIGWGYALDTILDEVSLPPVAFENGDWRQLEPLSGEEEFAFRAPIGHARVHHTIHSEAATIPVSLADKGIRECSFKINAFGYPEPVFDQIRTLVGLGLADTEPIAVNGASIAPRSVLSALLARSQAGSPAVPGEPDGAEEIVTVAEGERDGEAISYRVGTLAHAADGFDAGARVTGIPPAIVARWLAEGVIADPGVYPPEQIVEPERLFDELARRGIETTVGVTTRVAAVAG